MLEPLSGYLWLGASLGQNNVSGSAASEPLTSGFNFGPALTSNRTVAELVQELVVHTNGEWVDASDPNAHHEASKLNLATDKAFHLLEWQPVWTFEETLEKTAAWYLHDEKNEAKIPQFTRQQIESYQNRAQDLKITWANHE